MSNRVKWTPEKADRLITGYLNGKSVRALMEEFNAPSFFSIESKLWKLAADYEVGSQLPGKPQRNGKPWTPRDRKLLGHMRKAKCTSGHVAVVLQRTEAEVREQAKATKFEDQREGLGLGAAAQEESPPPAKPRGLVYHVMGDIPEAVYHAQNANALLARVPMFQAFAKLHPFTPPDTPGWSTSKRCRVLAIYLSTVLSND